MLHFPPPPLFDSSPTGELLLVLSPPLSLSLSSPLKEGTTEGWHLLFLQAKIKTQTSSLPGALSPPTQTYLFFLVATEHRRTKGQQPQLQFQPEN